MKHNLPPEIGFPEVGEKSGPHWFWKHETIPDLVLMNLQHPISGHRNWKVQHDVADAWGGGAVEAVLNFVAKDPSVLKSDLSLVRNDRELARKWSLALQPREDREFLESRGFTYTLNGGGFGQWKKPEKRGTTQVWFYLDGTGFVWNRRFIPNSPREHKAASARALFPGRA